MNLNLKKMSAEDSQAFDSYDPELEQGIEVAEQSLLALKERYTQIQRDSARKAQLQQRQAKIKEQESELRKTEPIKTELRQIQAELETLELNLESKLFSWRSWQEPFWQAVRFGGIGVILGWILKSCTG